jgi:hypothetical protein
VIIYYEQYPEDDNNPQWWLEDSFEDCFPSMEVDDDVYEMIGNQIPITQLIQEHGR